MCYSSLLSFVCREFMFINVICVYLGILVSYTISISDDIRVVLQVTSEAGTANHSGSLEFIPVFGGVRIVRTLDFYVVLCR
jgi:hypothetical protein